MKRKKAVSGYRVIKGTDPASTLQRAVARYVESKGGFVLVIGQIQMTRSPGDLPMNFTVGVKCTGTPPTKKEESCKE